jgi:hypothetical protein
LGVQLRPYWSCFARGLAHSAPNQHIARNDDMNLLSHVTPQDSPVWIFALVTGIAIGVALSTAVRLWLERRDIR